MGASSSKDGPTMKAVIRGGKPPIAFHAEYPAPMTGADVQPGKDQVLIKISAAAINPADYKAPKVRPADL